MTVKIAKYKKISLYATKNLSRKQSRKKWKGSDSDSVALMTPLTTPIFDFHWVIKAAAALGKLTRLVFE